VYVISLVKVQSPVKITVNNFDKLVHLGIYFIFTLVWFAYFVGLKYRESIVKDVIKTSVLAFFVGVSIEISQQLFTEFRFGDVNDVLANTVGILLAVVFLYQIKKYKELKSVK